MSKKRPNESEDDDEEIDPEDNSFDDEERDEDDDGSDDSDESYGEKRKGSRRKKKLKRLSKRNKFKNKFIADEAEEDSEEEEEDESAGSDNEIDPDRKRGLKATLNTTLPEPRARRPGFMGLENDAEVEQYFATYNRGGYDDTDEEGGDDHDLLLPSMNDPKLFAVRCMFGFERETVVSLLNKFLYYEEQGSDHLQIYSVTSNDKFPGKIYIEADNEAHVRHAIKDTNNLTFKGNHRVKIVPIKEVPTIFIEDETKNIEIKKGSFVRIKSHHLYKGDLAKVTAVDMSKFKVDVVLVPRLTPDDLRNEKDRKAEGGSNRSRPPLKLLPEEELKEITGSRAYLRRERGENETISVNDKLFFTREGFQRKAFNLSRIDTKNVVPTFEELQTFLKGEPTDKDKKEVEAQILNMVGEGKTKINIFTKGDKVIVCEGDLKNNIGIVMSTAENEVKITLDLPGLFESMSFPPSSLGKYFRMGETVRVVEGEHEGFTGFVSSIEGKIATIIEHETSKQIKTLTNNLKVSIAASSDNNKRNFFELKKFDLVRLVNNETAGVILKMEGEKIIILDTNGSQRSLNTLQIDSKIDDRRTVIQNHHMQNITVGCTIKILDGAYKAKICTVKHIFKEFLFLFNSEMIHTSGIVVERSNNCYLITQNMANKQRSFGTSSSAANNSHDDPKKGDSQGNNKGRDPKKNQRENLVGQSCTVRLGIWKGHQGIIKDADDKSVRLELTTKTKIITIPREQVDLGYDPDNASSSVINSNLQVGKTPMIYSGRDTFQSPYYVNSPAYQNASSAYTNNSIHSPAYDSKK